VCVSDIFIKGCCELLGDSGVLQCDAVRVQVCCSACCSACCSVVQCVLQRGAARVAMCCSACCSVLQCVLPCDAVPEAPELWSLRHCIATRTATRNVTCTVTRTATRAATRTSLRQDASSPVRLTPNMHCNTMHHALQHTATCVAAYCNTH